MILGILPRAKTTNQEEGAVTQLRRKVPLSHREANHQPKKKAQKDGKAGKGSERQQSWVVYFRTLCRRRSKQHRGRAAKKLETQSASSANGRRGMFDENSRKEKEKLVWYLRTPSAVTPEEEKENLSWICVNATV